LFGSIFFTTGFLSWRKKDIWYFSIPDLKFIPQGIAICFYGSIIFRSRWYLLFIRFLSIGTGFNEYNQQRKQITIFRWGFPGKNRKFKLAYSFDEIESLNLETKKLFLDTTNFYLYLLLNNQEKILLVKSDTFNIYTIQEIEYFSANLAQFLKLPLKSEF
jgi:hypothetical protein